MAITAQDVNKLRKMTGAGMMDCKKALTEADGDFDQAIEILRKKGQKVSAKRAEKEATEGSIFIKTNDDNTESVLVALNCETDFVAKNEEFIALGQAVIDAAASEKSSSVEDLLKVKSGELTIGDKIVEFIGKIGEKIEVSALETVSGEKVVSYIHANNKLGVLVELKNVNGAEVIEAGKDVAMQIAAMNPIAVDKDGVDQDVIAKEVEIGKEQAIAEGKPEGLAEKIAQGKLNKFFKETTLLNQQFVKDNSMTVAKYLDGIYSGLTVASFKRISIG
ncbi:translation elongation factor Ts [Bacteroidota bacterium]